MTAAGQAPLVTVLMPVCNGEQFLLEAINSILGQTFADFELLVIDDGSTDRSAEIVKNCKDSRISFVRNQANLGLVTTLNRGFDLAQGKYVARMDCDDISLPCRLAKQTAYMERNPECGVCGSWFRKFGKIRKVVRLPTDSESIKCGLLFNATVGHPTVMIRRDFLDRHSLQYDPLYKNAEDFELWARTAQLFNFANIDEVLLQYRVHSGQVTQSAALGQREAAGRVRLMQLSRLGIEPTLAEFEIHQAVSMCVFDGIDDLFARAEEWLCKLKETNDRLGVYPERAFSRTLVERWLTFCKKAFMQGQFSTRGIWFPQLLDRCGLGYDFVIGYMLRQLKTL